MDREWMTQDWTTGDLNAVVKNLGDDLARKFQKDEVKVVEEEGGLVAIKEVLPPLFDKHGIRRPHVPVKLRFAVCDPNRDFYLEQPEMTESHYEERIQRLHQMLDVDTGITGGQLKFKAEQLLALIKKDPQVANIANGVWLPVVLTKRESDDIGAELERQLAGVGRSYEQIFPGRKFYNYRKGELKGQVSIVSGSRYKSVWEKKKSEHFPALFFPNPLQGFSVYAQREQMGSLPSGFVLSGADIEPWIMYRDILARGFHTPGHDLAALSWRSADDSLRFEAIDDGLHFGRRGSLGYAYGSYSGGLLFLG